MKRALLVPLVLATLFAPLAFAGDRGVHARDLHIEVRHDYRASASGYGWRAPPPSSQYRYHRAPPRYAAPYVAPRRYAPPRAYAPPRYHQSRPWRSGQYLPSHYRARSYVVDHRSYRLPPPPRGYHYVRVNNDAVLVAIASGLIADVLMHALHR